MASEVHTSFDGSHTSPDVYYEGYTKSWSKRQRWGGQWWYLDFIEESDNTVTEVWISPLRNTGKRPASDDAAADPAPEKKTKVSNNDMDTDNGSMDKQVE